MDRRPAPDWLNLFATQFCMVLLFVFIWVFCITPLRGFGPILLRTPLSRFGEKSPDRYEDLRIYVRADGVIIVGEEIVGPTRLRAIVGALAPLRYHEPPEIRLHADRNAPFGSVRQVVRVLQDAGRTRFVLMLRPAE